MKKTTGNIGEKLARKYAKNQGMKIIEVGATRDT